MPNLSTPDLVPALLLLSASGCSASPSAPLPPAQSPEGVVHACSPAVLGRFAGEPATSELGARMLAATGKRVIRWVQPGMMVTMDFSEDRLTVYLDAANRVERASCG